MDLTLRNSRIKLSVGQLFWREVGRGPTLVFLHGSWSDSSQWLPVIEQLHQNYHCFAPDLLGFGESERPKLHYSIQLELECLLQFLEALHLSDVYLIGHSLGGWVAASYALKYPDQVRGLVLLAPEGVQSEDQPGNLRWVQWLVGQPPIVYSLLRSLLPLSRLLGRHKGIIQALQQRQQLLDSPTACQLLVRRRFTEIQAELLQDELEWLKVPTLILQGGNDTPDAIARSQTYGDRTPNAQLQMLERGGADLPEALPEIVAQQINDFIRLRT